MEGSSKLPCIYCTAPAQELNAGPPRTLGSLRRDYSKWNNESGEKFKCKEYNNVKNTPLFESFPDKALILVKTPPPGFHIVLGILNHI